jgi:hypothetical protein
MTCLRTADELKRVENEAGVSLMLKWDGSDYSGAMA